MPNFQAYHYKKQVHSGRQKILSYLSYLIISMGMVFVFWSFYPVISFEIYSRLFIEKKPQSGVVYAMGSESVSGFSASLSKMLMDSNNQSGQEDFSNVNKWFPSAQNIALGANVETLSLENVKDYRLSIPKLQIENAIVKIGSEDLTNNLIHYAAKSLPGELGNVVVFGHSTLPQLYNPKNYKTIFTYLPSLDKGDMVKVHLGQRDFDYEIFDLFVVNPDQIQILDQQYDSSYLTLVTCVPPGTYWKRLVIKAKLKV